MRSAACPACWRRRSRITCLTATCTPARDKRPAVLRRCRLGRTRSARHQRCPAIKLSDLAAQAKVVQHEPVIRLSQKLLDAASLCPQIEPDLYALLLHGQDASAGFVKLVDLAFTVRPTTVAG